MKHLVRFFLILVMFCSVGFGAPKKSTSVPVKTTQTVEIEPGSKILSPQKDAELRDWIIGIQHQATQAIEQAKSAEADTKTVVDALVQTQKSLLSANNEVITLDSAIKAQTSQLNNAIAEQQKAQEHVTKLTKKNNFLTTVLGLIAAAAAIFAALWLKIPNLSPPWGLVATIAAGPVIFGLIKLLL